MSNCPNNRFDKQWDDITKRHHDTFGKAEKRVKWGIAAAVVFSLVYWALILSGMILGVIWLFHHV